MPVTAPPAAIAPNATPAHGGMFGAHSASTSPGAKPRAASAAGDVLDARGERALSAPVSPSTSAARRAMTSTVSNSLLHVSKRYTSL